MAETTRVYWGWTIAVRAEPNADGSWTAHAKLQPEASHSGALASEIQATGASAEAARSAVMEQATAAVDRARMGQGKR